MAPDVSAIRLAPTAIERFRSAWVWSGLIADDVGRSGFARLGRVAAWMTASGFLVAFLVLWARGGTPGLLASYAFEALAWSSLVTALGVAARLPESRSPETLVAFASASGVPPARQAAGTILGPMRAVARAVVVQSAVLATVQIAAARSLAQAALGLRLAVVWMVAAALTAALWAMLARWAAALGAERRRLCFLAFVVGPMLANAAFGDVPTIHGFIQAASAELASPWGSGDR